MQQPSTSRMHLEISDVDMSDKDFDDSEADPLYEQESEESESSNDSTSSHHTQSLPFQSNQPTRIRDNNCHNISWILALAEPIDYFTLFLTRDIVK